MALATTTLSVACSATDTIIKVASAASIATGRVLRIDSETMIVANNWVSGTTIPVLRGQDGTTTVAHVITANVTHGLASDFAAPPAGIAASVTYPAVRPRVVQSITATSTLTLPPAGQDTVVILNGTSVITLTVPVPTKDMDGQLLYIVSNGAAAHVLTFTSGLSGAGSSYDVVTINATAPAAFSFIACNALWMAVCGPAISGTTTNIAGAIA
jgi:hypothetical protein